MTLRSYRIRTGTPEVDVARTARAWTDRSAQLVDVREPDEWEKRHIPDSIHIPLGRLGVARGELMKEIPVIVFAARECAVCRGRRS